MEKYGTVPPKFTKAWWDYIWMYYKWHFVATAVAAVLIITTAVQCATRTVYDLTVNYIGDAVIGEEAQAQAEAAMTEQIDDANGNGKKDVFFQILNVGGTGAADAQYEYAMQIKASTEYVAGEAFLYLFSKKQWDNLNNNGAAEGLFIPTSEWRVEGGLETETAVDISGNAFFAAQGVPADDLYMAVRAIRPDEEKEQVNVIRSENAVKLANYILNY